MRRKAWLLFLLSLSVGIMNLLLLLMVVAQLNLGVQPQWVGNLIILGLGIGAIAPMVLLAYLFPPRPVEIWSLGGDLHYRFRDATCARDFAMLNPDATEV